MADKNLILPFIVGAREEKEEFTHPTELACIVCMSEWQRKKTRLLRGAPEKISFISKIHYPFWAVPIENSCLVLDGLASLSHNFSFKETANTSLFIEDLKKNSVVHQEFMATLEKHAKNVREFASAVNVPFRALIVDKELLGFFLEHLKSDSFLSKNSAETEVLIPLEIDEKTATETRDAVVNCFRRINANAKGLQYALEVLNEEVEFHKRTVSYEIEWLKEKCEAEISSLKPEVEERVRQLNSQRDAVATKILKATEKKVEVLDKKREKYMRKLKGLEQRKEAVQKKIHAYKQKKGTTKEAYWNYELGTYDRKISGVKKEIKAIMDAIENVKKEGNRNVKEVDEEFRGAIAIEEEKINQLSRVYESKIDKKKKQIEKIISEAMTITKSVESLMDEIQRAASVFREQIKIDWKLDESALLCVPIYMIRYTKENEERYNLFSPITISEDTSVLQDLLKILTLTPEPRLKLLIRPKSKKLHEMLSSCLIKKIQNEEAFRENINKLCSANNLLEWRGFEENLNKGLEEVKNNGWLTLEEAAAVYRSIKSEEE